MEDFVLFFIIKNNKYIKRMGIYQERCQEKKKNIINETLPNPNIQWVKTGNIKERSFFGEKKSNSKPTSRNQEIKYTKHEKKLPRLLYILLCVLSLSSLPFFSVQNCR